MLSLGIICYQGHSSSAALVKDGQVLFAISEERFTRIKHDDAFPINSIRYILSELNLSIEQIDEIIIAWSIKKTIIGQFKKLRFTSFRFIFEIRDGRYRRSRLSKFLKIYNLKNEIRTRLKYSGKIKYVDHHLTHAMCSYVQSEARNAVIFVADGMGESAATSIYQFHNEKIKLIYRDEFPNSLGVFYSAGTQFLNFIPDSDEFKVMGLSAYGKKSHYGELMKELYFFKDNHFFLHQKYFDIQKNGNQFFSYEYKKLIGSVISNEQRADFAYSLQVTLEKVVLEIIRSNRLKDISDHFCSAGGIFLNCLLNQKIRETKWFEKCSFFPVADDNGTAIGAAWLSQRGKFELKKMDHLYLGPSIQFDETLLPKNLMSKSFENISEVAKLIDDGFVIAWAQGEMEFGHRALGNRSILADPRNKNIKNIINSKVKFREDYRPFAPSIMCPHLSDYFESDSHDSYEFMIETLKAKERAINLTPAVVHEDGTSRVQCVSKNANELFYNLINEFYKLTGCPMVLNTSFNLNGMPIVLSFSDAIECFVNSEIDYLVVENRLIWK